MRFIDLEDLDRSKPEIVTILTDLEKAKAEVSAEQDPKRREQLIEQRSAHVDKAETLPERAFL